MSTVYVASASKEKTNAVQQAFLQLYPNQENHVVPLDNAGDISSGVPEQPMNDEIYTGAWNRLRGLKSLLLKRNVLCPGDLIISFESGIWVGKNLDGTPGDWGLEGTICLAMEYQTRQDRYASNQSSSRRYPYFLIKDARSKGITTLKEHNKLAADWFKENPSASKMTREEAMMDVCSRTVKTLRGQQNSQEERGWVAEFDGQIFVGQTMNAAQTTAMSYLSGISTMPSGKVSLYREGATEEEKHAPIVGYY